MLKKKQKVIATAFGVGLSWGSIYFSTDLRYLSLIEYEGKL